MTWVIWRESMSGEFCVATIKLVMKHFVALGQKMQKT